MSKAVQSMFDSISYKYDIANDVLSFGIHRLWRHKALKKLDLRAGHSFVDVCTGTGDVALHAARIVGPSGSVIGVDFVQSMLDLAEVKKQENASVAEVNFVNGDAMSLPLETACCDRTAVSFGIRNVDEPIVGLQEMHRILKAGGKAVILEFGQPTIPGLAWSFRMYSKYLMPWIGAMLTGNRAAYTYLPETSAAFPAAEKFTSIMDEAGFSNTSFSSLFGGVAYIYYGEKA